MVKKFNDVLAILIGVVIIPGIWVAQGLGVLNLGGTEIIGCTIAIETLVAQHYYRKLKPED